MYVYPIVGIMVDQSDLVFRSKGSTTNMMTSVIQPSTFNCLVERVKAIDVPNSHWLVDENRGVEQTHNHNR